MYNLYNSNDAHKTYGLNFWTFELLKMILLNFWKWSYNYYQNYIFFQNKCSRLVDYKDEVSTAFPVSKLGQIMVSWTVGDAVKTSIDEQHAKFFTRMMEDEKIFKNS